MTVNVALGIGSPLWVVIVAPWCHGALLPRELSCRLGVMVRENAAVIEESQRRFSFFSGFGSITSGSRCRLGYASWDGGGIEVNRELVILLFIPQCQDHRDGRAAVGS
jgi:hypothetical protein